MAKNALGQSWHKLENMESLVTAEYQSLEPLTLLYSLVLFLTMVALIRVIGSFQHCSGLLYLADLTRTL